jgi:inactive phospholipase C-like protein 2/inactive phospholipase C-like protein 1
LEEKKLTIFFILCVSLFAVADCWRWMVRGSNLVKVRPNGRTYNRFFSLDEDLSCIRWLPTSKKASKATGM